MPYVDYTPEEIVCAGEDLYQRRLRPQLEVGNIGKYLVLDIETGAYEIDEEDIEATERLLERAPEGVLYGLRIGYPTAYTIGARTEPGRR